MIVCYRTKTVVESTKLKVPGFEVVNVLTWHKKDSIYYTLSPYHLKTETGAIFENWYQSGKLNKVVYNTISKPNFRSSKINWEYKTPNGTEIHLKDNVIQPEYFKWRDSLLSCPNYIRYANGYNHRHEVLFSVEYINGVEHRYNYIESRKYLYFNKYVKLVRNLEAYRILKEKVRNGVNVCITEVDVPFPGKKGNHGKFLDDNGFYHPTLENLEILINDPSEPFGHGLVLCYLLIYDLTYNL